MWIQFHFKNLISIPWWPFIMYFCHPLSIILLNVTLIPFYSVNSLWLGCVGGRVQALPFYYGSQKLSVWTDTVMGPQWITPCIRVVVSPLHVDSGLDCAIGFGPQGLSKQNASGLEKGSPIRLPSCSLRLEPIHNTKKCRLRVTKKDPELVASCKINPQTGGGEAIQDLIWPSPLLAT